MNMDPDSHRGWVRLVSTKNWLQYFQGQQINLPEGINPISPFMATNETMKTSRATHLALLRLAHRVINRLTSQGGILYTSVPPKLSLVSFVSPQYLLILYRY